MPGPRLIVMRLTDMARVHPRMDRTHQCARCKQPVGIYPSGQIVLRRYNDVEIVCSVCMNPADRANARYAPGVMQEQESVPARKPT